MTELYATNDWGILVTHKDVENNIFTREQLQEAGFERMEPVAGTIYMDDVGDYVDATEQPIWFLAISQPGLFDAPYEGIEDIVAEVKSTGIPMDEQDVSERLCRLNVVLAG